MSSLYQLDETFIRKKLENELGTRMIHLKKLVLNGERNPEQRPTAADCYHHLLQLHSSMPPVAMCIQTGTSGKLVKMCISVLVILQWVISSRSLIWVDMEM